MPSTNDVSTLAYTSRMLLMDSFTVVLGEEKRRQVGEMTTDGQLRFFNEQEMIERERESWFTRIFGTESWTNSVRRR